MKITDILKICDRVELVNLPHCNGMEFKLRAIVEMLPEIKQLLIWCAGTVAESDMHKMQERIERWENE